VDRGAHPNSLPHIMLPSFRRLARLFLQATPGNAVYVQPPGDPTPEGV
jgi:hypothetical protein